MAEKDTSKTAAASSDAAAATAAATTQTASTTPEAKNPGPVIPAVVDREPVAATDRTTTRVLRAFVSHGAKGSVSFRVGIPVTAADIEDYFPSAAAYSNRVAWGFIGLPSVGNSGLRRGL